MSSMLHYDTSRDPGSQKVLPDPPHYAPKPIWQPFAGFSFLFGNPGNSSKNFEGFEQLEIDDSTINSISLYSKIAAAVSKINPLVLSQRFLFFALPFNTYHVTVWDGVNTGNKNRLLPESLEAFDSYFAQDIRSSLRKWPPFGNIYDYQHWFDGLGPIRFHYSGLRARGNTVLVVDLEPDEDSKKVFDAITKRRTQLDEIFSAIGKPENLSLRPHVAVGYFSNSSLGESALFQNMDRWMGVFNEIVRGSQIEFHKIELYAFFDMITYMKPRQDT